LFTRLSSIDSRMSIFETPWIQSEFDKQNNIIQAYFKMFKGLEPKDESYMRRWSFEQEKEKRERKIKIEYLTSVQLMTSKG